MEAFETTHERCESEVGDTMRITSAAIYARYSSEEQTGGESVEYQLERCREYVADQSWLLAEANIFIDEARSGTTTYRREAFNQMVAAAKAKDRPFDVVVTWSTSRFGRDQDEAIFHKISLRRQGVEVKFVSQPVPDGHIGTLIERIYEWKDEFDSIQIGEYAFQGQKQVTQKGFHGGGKAPYGYRRVKVPDPGGKTDKDGKIVEHTTYEVVLEEAKVVKRIFGMYADGASCRKVALMFNEEGIPSPRASTWDPSGVRVILLNENYLGHRVWNQTRRNKKVQRGTKIPKPRDEWVIAENAHEAIVDRSLWEAVQKRRGQTRKHVENGAGGYNTGHSPYFLSGLLKCEECGGNFTITGSKKRGGTRYYRCGRHANRGKSVCANNRLVRKDRIEGAAIKAVSEELLTVEVIESIVEEYKLAASENRSSIDTQDLDRAIQQVDREITNLTASLKAVGPAQELVDEMKACQKRKAALEIERLEKAATASVELEDIDLEEARAAIENLAEILEDATPEEKKALMRENVTEIQIPKNEEPLLVSDPEGLLTSLGCFFRMVTPRGVA